MKWTAGFKMAEKYPAIQPQRQTNYRLDLCASILNFEAISCIHSKGGGRV
jgi:hypothetical protein